MRHALWTRLTAKSAGVWFPEIIMAPSMFWGLGKARNMKRSIIIILAFYFIDPFPIFLVKDHFSCKYAPRIKACMLVQFKFLAFASFYSTMKL